MSGYASLRKTGAGWEFESEAALEDFVWANLQPLFGLTPLKQQYCVSGQFCDLLALGENKQLVVLELKNVEDRYIVQQLTRYYDALLEEKPFSEEVDYRQPVLLVAIAPTFHRDNFTDRKYHTLSFRFLQFAILQDGGEFYLQLTDLDSGKIFQSEIPHQERENPENIPSPPRALLNLLAKCTDDEREAILKIRIKLLSFDQRMQEMTATGSVTYGKGKNNCCAELRLDKQSGKLILFLSLPYAHKWTEKKFIARMRVWTDWKSVSDVAHVPKGMGETKISQAEYESGIRPKNGYYMHLYPSYKSPITADFKDYMKLVNKQSNSLDSLVELALETWLARL